MLVTTWHLINFKAAHPIPPTLGRPHWHYNPRHGSVNQKAALSVMHLLYDKLSRVLFWGCVSGLLAEVLTLLLPLSCWKVFFTLWLLSTATYLLIDSIKLPLNGKAVLITGCDTGFGNAVALHLDNLGARVFAACLHADGEGAQKLKQEGSTRLHVLQMDVTKQEEINRAVEEVKKLLGPGESLWGLVNNAGINTLGAVEWVPLAATRKVFDVNVFGIVAVTKAFLPLIRQAKGRVVTVGSSRGRFPSPMGSTYDMSKYAMEAFNDGLRNEMRPFGVKCSLIEPGNFSVGTKIHSDELVSHCSKELWANMDDEVKSSYGKEVYDKFVKMQKHTATSGNPDVSEVLVAITEALTQWIPQGRYIPACRFIYLLMFVQQHFPEWVYDRYYHYALKDGF